MRKTSQRNFNPSTSGLVRSLVQPLQFITTHSISSQAAVERFAQAADQRIFAKKKWEELEAFSVGQAAKLNFLMEYPVSSNVGLKECFTIHRGRKDGTAKKLSTWLVAAACDSVQMQIVGMLLHGKKMLSAELARGDKRLSYELNQAARDLYEELCDMRKSRCSSWGT